MAKSKLFRNEYYQLLGLFKLASDHVKALKQIELSAAELVGEENDGSGYYGHVTDAIYGDDGAAYVIERLEIAVEKE